MFIYRFNQPDKQMAMKADSSCDYFRSTVFARDAFEKCLGGFSNQERFEDLVEQRILQKYLAATRYRNPFHFHHHIEQPVEPVHHHHTTTHTSKPASSWWSNWLHPHHKPVEQPIDTTPVDNTPVDTTPDDTTPVDTTPDDTTPDDNTPVIIHHINDDIPKDTTGETGDHPTDLSYEHTGSNVIN